MLLAGSISFSLFVSLKVQTEKTDSEIPKLLGRISLHICGIKPMSGGVDRASATETVDSGSISGQVKPKTIKIGIHNFPA